MTLEAEFSGRVVLCLCTHRALFTRIGCVNHILNCYHSQIRVAEVPGFQRIASQMTPLSLLLVELVEYVIYGCLWLIVHIIGMQRDRVARVM